MARRLSSPVFVGRAAELAILLDHADAAERGQAGLIVVGGEAGVGKTRLVSELAAALGERGWLVLEGGTVALGEDALPFGPIVEALRDLIHRVDPAVVAAAAGANLRDLSTLLPELSTTSDRVSVPLTQTEWLQSRIFEGVLGLLGRLGESTPVLLVVEDIHWADRSTRDLLAFLARNLRDERAFVVATFRADELHRRHPLGPWLAEAERQPRVDRVDLRRFDRDDLVELLSAILGSPPAASLIDSIARRSDGNAFFAEELLAASDDVARGLPQTLREVLLVRLATVSKPATRLIEVAAVAGREVEHELLQEVSGLTEDELLESLREAVATQLLVAESDDRSERYAFRHALVQEAVYDDLLPSERRRLHAAYAAALERCPAGAGAEAASRLAELAHHWAAAHEASRAVAASVAAGDASRALYAFAEAGRQYERAIELWDIVPADDRPGDRDLADLFDAAGEVLGFAGDSFRWVSLARRAIELADRAPGADEDRGRRATFREHLGRAAYLSGDTATSITILEEAIELVTDDERSPAKARVLAGLAANLMLAGQARRSRAIAEQAIEMAVELGDRVIESHAKNSLGVDLGMLGEVEAGIEVLRESLAIAESLRDPFAIGRAYANLGSVVYMAEQVEESAEIALRGAEANRRLGNARTFGTFLEINAASGLIELGRYDDAAAILARNAQWVDRGVETTTLHFHLTSAQLALQTGRLDEAGDHLAVVAEQVEGLRDAQFTGPYFATLSDLAIARGDPATALGRSQEGFERLAGTDDGTVTGPLAMAGARAAADLAEAAHARRDEAAATTAILALDEVVARYRASVLDHIGGSGVAAHEIGWRLAILDAERGRAVGSDDPARWAAVRPAIAARPFPFLEAYVLFREAEAWARAGDVRAAVGPARAGDEIARRIGAATVAAPISNLARRLRIDLGAAPDETARAAGQLGGHAAGNGTAAAADPFGLTAREREVLRLVAEGYTNRRIAQSLFISESTAGVHVSNILGKLGVGTRTEAAAVAVRVGLDGSTSA
ncbi:MAG: AAA family ATPase [Chloroflexota bacterium]